MCASTYAVMYVHVCACVSVCVCVCVYVFHCTCSSPSVGGVYGWFLSNTNRSSDALTPLHLPIGCGVD